MWWDGCDTVRCGFWVNWSTDAVRGSTLTLPTQWALVISAFLALFVKLVGGYLWELTCFIIHQISASSKNRDDISHQFQLILRNTEPESTFFWKLLKVTYAHKGARLEAFRRSSWLLVLAVFHGLGIWVAGGLSSRFIAGSDEIQSVPGKCGWMKEINVTSLDDATFETANALLVMARHGYLQGASYARSCYSYASSNPTSCGNYILPTLSYNTTISESCPFDEKICEENALKLDTGVLRSDLDLGINTRSRDAISIRKVLTCVPLKSENYTDGWQPIPDDFLPQLDVPSGTLAIGYKFGKEPNSIVFPDYTFVYDQQSLKHGDLPYSLAWVSSFIDYQGDQTIPFDPIPELQSTVSDVTVVSLVNRISYRNPVDDAWFYAHNCTSSNGSLNICTATNPGSQLGCEEQYQFCTSDGSNCTPFTGLYGTTADASIIPNLNPTQKALFQLLWKISWMTQLNFQLAFIARENLVANEYLWDASQSFGYSAPLPADHWQREVSNWMNTTLSYMQRAALAFARVPDFDVSPGMSMLGFVVEPEDPVMQLLCHRVKGRSKVHTSFSVLGLFLTLSIGLLIISLNLFLPKAVARYQRRTGKGVHKRREWIESSAFQLQRMAAEGRGIGPWKGKEDDVPVLVSRGNLFNLSSLSLGRGWTEEAGYEGAGDGEKTGKWEELEMSDLADGKGSIRSPQSETHTRLLAG